MRDNLGLLIKRQNKLIPFSYAFASSKIVESCVFESAFANNTVCPLYQYPETDKKDLFSEHESKERKPNTNPNLFKTLSLAYKKQPTPEEFFYYIYSNLYSNTYRSKYAGFLKTDFPRIPFTKDYEIFKEMAKLGEELVELHLLKSKKFEKGAAKFPVKDGCKVEKREYKEKEEKVYINDKQYFSGVSKEVWNYYIGGYQVLDKWLKERQGRTLSDDDIAHFLKVITALSQTIELQKEIDNLYPKVEKTILAVNI